MKFRNSGTFDRNPLGCAALIAVAVLLMFLLARCAPMPARSVVAVPVVASPAPDLGGTRAVLDAAIASTAEASRVAVAGTAEARAVASAQAQGTVEARVWGMTAQALEIQADGATATERARGTATALAWPAVSAARQEIERRNTLADERARWSLRLEPYKQGAAIALQYLLLALLGWLLFTGINHIVPAAADRIRGAEVITAYQISEPRPVPLLAAPVGSSSRFVMDGNHGERVSFPLTDEQLTTLAHALYTGTPFAERHFTARAVPNFRAVQDVAIGAGLAAWRNEAEPRQGCVLTEKGERFFFGQVLGLPSPAGEYALEGVR